MGLAARTWGWVLVLAACKLDVSGVGGDESSSGEATSGTGSTTVSTTATTSMPTTGATEATTTAPTSTTDGTGSETMAPTTETADDSTGEPELGPFGDLAPLPGMVNSNQTEDDPTLRADMLEIYFSRTMGPPHTEDIFRATRASTDEEFGEVERVEELSIMDFADASPELSSDGLVISFSGQWPDGPGANDVMISTRKDFDSPWAEPVRIDELTTPSDDGSLATNGDGTVGYLCRDFGGGPYWELMRTTYVDGSWAEAIALDDLNDAGKDCSPWVDAGETELWFSSVRPGSLAGENIWRAAIVAGDIAAPLAVEELNTDARDEDPWISPDGRTIVFASDRDGTFDIWTATR